MVIESVIRSFKFPFLLLIRIQDWHPHKRDCATFTVVMDKQIGYPLSVKAVLFPVMATPPLFINFPYRFDLNSNNLTVPKRVLGL